MSPAWLDMGISFLNSSDILRTSSGPFNKPGCRNNFGPPASNRSALAVQYRSICDGAADLPFPADHLLMHDDVSNAPLRPRKTRSTKCGNPGRNPKTASAVHRKLRVADQFCRACQGKLSQPDRGLKTATTLIPASSGRSQARRACQCLCYSHE